MPRKKIKTDHQPSKSAVQPTSPFRAAARGKKGLAAAGLRNMNEALRLTDAATRFSNPLVAAGFCAHLMQRPFTMRELEEFESAGRTLFAGLGVDAEQSAEPVTGQEVVASLPVIHLDKVERFHAIGLRRTGLSHRLSYVELRGRCDVVTATRMVEELGGTLVVISRPIALDQTVSGESVHVSVPEKSPNSSLVTMELSEEAIGQTEPGKLVVTAAVSDAVKSHASSTDNALTDLPKNDSERSASAPSGQTENPSATQPEQKQAFDVAAPPEPLPSSHQAAAISKLIEENVPLEDIPVFMRKGWQHEKLRRALETRNEESKPSRIPTPRSFKPPGDLTLGR